MDRTALEYNPGEGGELKKNKIRGTPRWDKREASPTLLAWERGRTSPWILEHVEIF
jgi:hypothetical protein